MHDMRMRAAMLVTSCALTLPILAGADQKSEVARIHVVSESPYGSYLVDHGGRPLYIFTSDTEHGSTCYGSCARAWPPVTTEDMPVTAARAVDGGRLGTFKRQNGARQVTYAGHPLYYYARDERGATPMGQDIRSFGGEWYLLSPEGEVIKTAAER